MSTEHNGQYCIHKDKMMLTRENARRLAVLRRCDCYECPHCGTWHLARKMKPQQRTAMRRKAAKSSRK